MTLVRGSPEVIAMIQAEDARLRAEVQRKNSIAGLRYGGAISLAALAVGGGIWLGCAGYDRVIGSEKRAQEEREYEAKRTKEDADRNAAFLSSIKSVTIPVNGTVTGTVNLADNQQVKVSGNVGLKDGARVTLSVPPDATIGMRAVNDAARPTAAQLQDAKPASGAPVVSDFVKFNRVGFGNGEVVTGWRFGKATDKPSEEWCHYREPQPDGTSRLITIGEDGHRVGLPNPSPFPSVDLQAAFASCVWTAATAPARVNRDDNPPPRSHVITARAKG